MKTEKRVSANDTGMPDEDRVRDLAFDSMMLAQMCDALDVLAESVNDMVGAQGHMDNCELLKSARASSQLAWAVSDKARDLVEGIGGLADDLEAEPESDPKEVIQ